VLCNDEAPTTSNDDSNVEAPATAKVLCNDEAPTTSNEFSNVVAPSTCNIPVIETSTTKRSFGKVKVNVFPTTSESTFLDVPYILKSPFNKSTIPVSPLVSNKFKVVLIAFSLTAVTRP
jgi:hypothetical protein